jgi:glycosyltransferase involved in cell wall biosynthesis
MRFSHVSAVQNEERWLPRMIESWQVATKDLNAELVVVDDHSDDDTHAIALRYAQADPRIKVLSSARSGRRGGKVAAFNLGVENASADFVGLIGGDDEFPIEAFRRWSQSVDGFSGEDSVVAFGRLRTMSSSPKFDNVVIPREPVGNRSGGTSLFSRALAAEVFPIPEELPSEDTWTSFLLPALADTIVEVPGIILHYRIHPGNSNPRHRDFASMTESIHRRARAHQLLLQEPRLRLTEGQRAQLVNLVDLEAKRYSGDLFGVLRQKEIPLRKRISAASMTTPTWWRARQGMFRQLSGR